MSFKPDEKKLMFRRCNSEPPLGNQLTSTSTQSNSSAHSLQEIKTSCYKLSRQNTNGNTGKNVIRSSTFPLLPNLNNKTKGHQMFLKSLRNENHVDHLPCFSNLAFNREISTDQRGIQGRKFQLRSRYVLDAAAKAPIKKEVPANPLRKRVQQINNNEDRDTDNAKKQLESHDLVSDIYSGKSTAIRRLSVITEKSNFSRASNKTTIFDLEDENRVHKCVLPSVERDGLSGKKPSYLEKNSLKLQEHVQKTEKQFNPLESKAVLLCSWLKSLETEG